MFGLLLVIEAGAFVRDALALGVAAREGGRAAAVYGSDARVRDAVRASAGPLEAERIEVAVTPPPDERRRGDAVTVSLSYVVRIRIPLLSRLVDGEHTLRSSVTMRLERDGPDAA